MELSKYIKSEAVEVLRSQIHPASYNPRKISDEGYRHLKRSVKTYGVVGGIVVNSMTGNTIVGGHKKVAVLDELNKYDEETHANDYMLRVDMVAVDLKKEMALNVALNNPNIGGTWDYDALRELVPDIDYKDAGLTEADLNMIGCDFLLQTEEENNIADELESMMSEVNARHEAEKAQRQMERAAKTAHMKEVKKQVKDAATKQAQDMDAYVMLSFDTWEAKANFCRRFGYDPYDKFLKGEVFDEIVERIE